MKCRFCILTIIIVILLIPITSTGEQSTGENISPVEWKWNPGSINTFSGALELSAYKGSKLNICLYTDLPADEVTGNENNIVFITVNGKRIPVLKQDNTVVFTPDEDNGSFSFIGQVVLPKKKRVHDVHFVLKITDEKGKELKTIQSSVNYLDTASAYTENTFYISFDIDKMTVILAVSAFVIWIAACFRNYYMMKKNGNGEKKYADL